MIVLGRRFAARAHALTNRAIAPRGADGVELSTVVRVNEVVMHPSLKNARRR